SEAAPLGHQTLSEQTLEAVTFCLYKAESNRAVINQSAKLVAEKAQQLSTSYKALCKASPTDTIFNGHNSHCLYKEETS
ncbi:hypothetical protein A2U01_0052312, partial [Trifolium medium]|nr:hypothetical protein [Trifolium medium]